MNDKELSCVDKGTREALDSLAMWSGNDNEFPHDDFAATFKSGFPKWQDNKLRAFGAAVYDANSLQHFYSDEEWTDRHKEEAPKILARIDVELIKRRLPIAQSGYDLALTKERLETAEKAFNALSDEEFYHVVLNEDARRGFVLER